MKTDELTKEIRERILSCLQHAISSLDGMDPENDKKERKVEKKKPGIEKLPKTNRK